MTAITINVRLFSNDKIWLQNCDLWLKKKISSFFKDALDCGFKLKFIMCKMFW
jgi:hypothetical protein